jgi:hypothetical protein
VVVGYANREVRQTRHLFARKPAGDSRGAPKFFGAKRRHLRMTNSSKQFSVLDQNKAPRVQSDDLVC